MLKNLLKSDKEARRIFGKKEIAIVLKQLDGITLTQSEKNRLSRDIRPKFAFIKKISKCADEFKLKKNTNTLQLIERALKLILQDIVRDKIKAVLLFGSHVEGFVTYRSDIDIGVVFTSISLREATKFRIRISGELPEKIDIQVFNVLPQKMKRSIVRKHRVLFKRKDFNNLDFTVRYLKDQDYFIRLHKILGVRV